MCKVRVPGGLASLLLPSPDLGKGRKEDLVLAFLELTFQLNSPTKACEIVREIYLAIDI